ncbi:MAG TPA: ChaB family protein [Thermoanaerobaculia bacterium]|jgi:cation transport regulator|nr:ChaB family protein [Thermoanaerobaculia bacterium]
MYDSIGDLPLVCRIHLPEAALKVYRDAFNRAWKEAHDDSARFTFAQQQAWIAVRNKFEREQETGRWVRRAARLEPRIRGKIGGHVDLRESRK